MWLLLLLQLSCEISILFRLEESSGKQQLLRASSTRHHHPRGARAQRRGSRRGGTMQGERQATATAGADELVADDSRGKRAYPPWLRVGTSEDLSLRALRLPRAPLSSRELSGPRPAPPTPTAAAATVPRRQVRSQKPNVSRQRLHGRPVVYRIHENLMYKRTHERRRRRRRRRHGTHLLSCSSCSLFLAFLFFFLPALAASSSSLRSRARASSVIRATYTCLEYR